MLMRAQEFTKMLPFGSFLRRPTVPLYHQDTVNHCPSCGGKQWHIGRSTAECAYCSTALPLASVTTRSDEPRFAVELKAA